MNTPILRITPTGIISLVPHIDIITGSTIVTVLCRTCGNSYREPWPGIIDNIERWIKTHAH